MGGESSGFVEVEETIHRSIKNERDGSDCIAELHDRYGNSLSIEEKKGVLILADLSLLKPA
jgi:hypothetical protein